MQTVIVIREGQDGPVIRTILAPQELIDAHENEIKDLADYGNQSVDFINPDECSLFGEIKAIFDDMNPPPEEDEDDDEDYEDEEFDRN